MPIYEYRCPQGHSLEMSRPMGERANEVACPSCGAEMTLAVSVPGVAHVAGGTGALRGAR